VGAFLYRWVHALHHRSANPGPWAGLSMHPVEHFLYYTVTLVPLLVPLHPLHFLYVIFHADIAPIGGHDGYAAPGGGGDFHFLHHAKYECNYGVPIVPLDHIFGTFVDYDEVVTHGYMAARSRAFGLTPLETPATSLSPPPPPPPAPEPPTLSSSVSRRRGRSQSPHSKRA